MVKYIIKRLSLSVLILFCVSVILYTLVRVMPVNFIEDQYYTSHSNTNVSDEELQQAILDANLEDIEKAQEQGYSQLWNKIFRDGEVELNKDGSVKHFSKGAVAIRSIVAGYANWLGNFLKGDMGKSFNYNRPVTEVIVDNMGLSFAVSFISLILELIIAVPLGIQSAYRQYGKLDYITTVLTMIGISFPSFFFGKLLIKWFAVDLGWFPVGSFDETNLATMSYSLVLPIAVLTILSVGSLMRYVRTNTLEVLNADYIRTARAKGASENSVVYKHVFRNTLIPLVTTLAGILPGLFGGAMITEQIFDLPGIGNVAYTALRAGDVPFIMGYNMFIAVLTILGVLLTDIMYAVVDPRVKLGA